MMQSFELTASDGCEVACYHWPVDAPRAVILIAHGMGEHARRYDAVALALNGAGYAVLANDHRGHGGTADGEPGWMGGDGWNRVLADAYELNLHAKSEYPGLPVVLLGHSMGSIMSQQYMTRYGGSVDAVVLSGSPGFKAGIGGVIVRLLSSFECWRLGPDKPSDLLQKALFGDANKPFAADDATGFEWLSRDASEVQKYLDDDDCGAVLTTGSLLDFFEGSRMSQTKPALAKIPTTLPIYVLSGTDDPVHSERKDIQRMLQAYYDQGLPVEVRWYEGGRHEMFNETNRDEVIADLIGWLNKQVS